MKTKLFLILILCFSINCMANSYLPLLQERTQWNVLHAFNTTVPSSNYKKTELLKLGADTIISGKTYLKLFSTYNKEATDSTIIGFLREDCETKRVYYRENNEEEKLLYDFNAQIGDTLYTYQRFSFIPDSTPNVITAIDSIEINGILLARRTVEITVFDQKESRFWIEGVGCEQGLIYHSYPGMAGGEIYYLLCMYKNGELFYQPQWEMFHDCFIWEIGTMITNVTMDDFYISQDKLHTSLSIINKNGQAFSAYLFDTQGKKVYQTTTKQAKLNIDTQSFPKGIYVLKIKSEDANQHITKIIL